MKTINHRAARSKSPSAPEYPAITVYISEGRWDTAGGGNAPATCIAGLVAEGFRLIAGEVITFAAGTPHQSRTYRFTCCPPTVRHLWVQRLQALAQRLRCGSMEVDEQNREVGQISDMLEIA